MENLYNLQGFKHKKSLGQNFLSDTNLLQAICTDAGVAKSDTVVEIGTGAGSLTAVLGTRAASVFSFEVDKTLQPLHAQTLANMPNVSVIFADVLRLTDDELQQIIGKNPFKVVANLPYYITTPLIMRFIESNLPIASLTVMVQQEVAERLTAKHGCREYGAITCQVRLRADVKITRNVSRQMFFPQPNVDSAVVHIVPKTTQNTDLRAASALIKAAFSMRRKTLANNICACYNLSKDEVHTVLRQLGHPEGVRGEALSVDEFVRLAAVLPQNK